MLISWIPEGVVSGKMRPFSSQYTRSPFVPKAVGIEGPVMSASRTAALSPFLAVFAANREVTRDFPTPPLPETMPITCFTVLFGFK